MSLAKQLIGEPAPKAESKTQESEEVRPLSAMELIDALAEQEFGSPTLEAKKNLKKPAEGAAPGKAMKQGGGGEGKVVAKAPGKVTYGKK